MSTFFRYFFVVFLSLFLSFQAQSRNQCRNLIQSITEPNRPQQDTPSAVTQTGGRPNAARPEATRPARVRPSAAAQPENSVTIRHDGQLIFSDAVKREQQQKDETKKDRFVFDEDENGWGTKILSDQDPTWSDPEYIKRLQEFASPATTNYGGRARLIWQEYSEYFNKFFPGELYQIMSSGTDANNYLFLWAKERFKETHQREPVNMKFISFRDVYAGAYGPITTDRRIIHDNPAIQPGRNFSPEELQAQIKREDDAIKGIEATLEDPTLDIGAIFLEPMPANYGKVRVYRIEFIKKLHDLAVRHKVPIYCDEILSGGGRTGKFWAFQHYQNDSFRFVPDLVTFGKGLATAGIFMPDQRSHWHNESDVIRVDQRRTPGVSTSSYFLKDQRQIDYVTDQSGYRVVVYQNGELKSETFFRSKTRLMIQGSQRKTTNMNALALLQSLQIVKTIWNRRLDLNAAETGRHLALRIQQARSYGLKNRPLVTQRDKPVPTGVGLFYSGFLDLREALGVDTNPLVGYIGRALFRLDTTKEDIDWLLSERWNWRFDSEVK